MDCFGLIGTPAQHPPWLYRQKNLATFSHQPSSVTSSDSNRLFSRKPSSTLDKAEQLQNGHIPPKMATSTAPEMLGRDVWDRGIKGGQTSATFRKTKEKQ